MRGLPGMLAAFAMLVPIGAGLLEAQAPPSGEALFQSGLAAFQARNYADAEQIFRRLREVDPKDTRAVAAISEIYMAQNKKAEAIQLLRAEIENDPQRPDYHSLLGNIFVRTSEYELAISEFQKALNGSGKDSPAAADLYYRIGEAQRRSGNLKEALAMFRRVRQIVPANPLAALQVALVLDAIGQTGPDLTDEYKTVLKLDPRNFIALNNLAYRLGEDGGDLDAAVEYAQRAREARPDSEDAADTLGWIYVRKGMPDQAIANLGDAMRKNQNSVSIRSHLAAALELKSDAPAWMQELKAALRRDYSAENERRITGLLQNIEK